MKAIAAPVAWEKMGRLDTSVGTFTEYNSGCMYFGQAGIFGTRNGRGTYVFVEDGSIYKGSWENGMKEGTGKYFWANGDVYEGEFHKDLRHGTGKYLYANGDVYDGDWVQGKKEGQGSKRKANGDKFKGRWRNDMKSGVRVITVNGNPRRGVWEDDKLVKHITEAEYGDFLKRKNA